MFLLRGITDDEEVGVNPSGVVKRKIQEATLYFFPRAIPGIAAASVSYPAVFELRDRDQDRQESGDASRRALCLCRYKIILV